MTTYAIHNTMRARHNRTARAQTVVRGMKQYVLDSNQRLVRNRPVEVSEADLLANLDELKEKVASQMVEVRTMDGRLVDLSTLTAPAVAPAPPLPQPLLDSAANDKPAGIPMPIFPDGPVPPSVHTTPTVPAPSEDPIMPEEQEWREPTTSVDPGTERGRRRRR